MIPDRFPRIVQDRTQGLIIGLAGDHGAIWFDAHIVECGSAAFNAQLELHWIEGTILGRGVPDQLLLVDIGALRAQAGAKESARLLRDLFHMKHRRPE